MAETIGRESRGSGRRKLHVVIISLFIGMVLSILTQGYWAVGTISNFVDIHVFNSATKMHFELLIWVMLITAVQFYGYYVYTLTLYDDIVVSKAPRGVRITHATLQFVLSCAIFAAALVLTTTIFVLVMNLEVMNVHNFDISILKDQYFGFLDLKYLLLYFALMDLFLMGISLNYERCAQCSSRKKQKLREARTGFQLSLIIGTLLFVSNLVAAIVFSGPAPSAADPTYNLEPNHEADFLVFSLIGLQAGYVLMDLFWDWKYAVSARPQEAVADMQVA